MRRWISFALGVLAIGATGASPPRHHARRHHARVTVRQVGTYTEIHNDYFSLDALARNAQPPNQVTGEVAPQLGVGGSGPAPQCVCPPQAPPRAAPVAPYRAP